MILAPLLLAAAVGQTCAEPPSRFGPPPCAAAQVQGCLPGYRRDVDASGRVIYRCDASAAAPPAWSPPPAPAPAPWSPPPRWSAPPAYAASPPSWHRGLLALVMMPGGTSVDRGRTTDGTLALGLEARGESGGARLRLGWEYSRPVSLVDLSFKFDLLDGPVSPFLAAGVGVAALDPEIMGLATTADRAWRATGSISGGVDLYLVPNLFASVELKARAFSRDEALEASAAHATTFLVGLGFCF